MTSNIKMSNKQITQQLEGKITAELQRIKQLDKGGKTYPRLVDDFNTIKMRFKNPNNKLDKFLGVLKEFKENSRTKQAVKAKLKEAKEQTRELFENMENLIEPTTKKTTQQRTTEREERYNNIKISKEEIRKRKKTDRLALGGMFKESFITEDIEGPLDSTKSILRTKLEHDFLNNDKKYNLVAFIVIFYEVIKSDGSKEQRHFHSNTMYISSFNVINQFVEELFESFYNNLEQCQHESDIKFSKFNGFNISTSKTKSTSGKSYFELPAWLKNKKCCINIKNNDEKCFKWALLAYKFYDTMKCNCESRHFKKYWNEIIEPEGCEYPVKLNDIEKWEIANNIKINVMEVVEGQQYCTTAYTSNHFNDNVVNLLLIEDGDNNHYVWVKNVNGLYYDPNNVANSHKTKFVCPQCLCPSFTSKDKLDMHIKFKRCQAFNKDQQHCEIEMPKEGENIMKFKNVNNEFMHPFHVVADFESTLRRVNIVNGNTERYQKHEANSYGLKYNCIHDEHSEPVKLFNNANSETVVREFVEELERLAHKSYSLLQQNRNNIIMTDEDNEKHSKNVACERCAKAYTKGNRKVRHHDHITGKFISSYCNDCNLSYQYKPFLPVYIHNLKGYDSHLFVNALYKYGENNKDISCIPNNEERYISISKFVKVDEYENDEGKRRPYLFEIRFLDTLAFMNTSIDKLSENLAKQCITIADKRRIFKNVSAHFENDEQFELMIKKGVYPYDYIDNYKRLSETKLPSLNDFYSQLSKSHISNDSYAHAINVWYRFNCKTLMDYHNLYLTVDVLLLADIWENFRAVCYKVYKLDCEYYYTAPGLSFDAMLQHTQIELELLTDLEMFEFVERGIRGGISQISHRHAIANNKYMKNYDPTKEDSYIIYLDANNLYGYAMCEYLPYKGFKWNNDDWTTDKILSLDDKGAKGYLFSVDLHIPEDKHDYFNNYVPCPENTTINKEWVSEWMKADYKQSKIGKLCTTFFDKVNYVVNYRYLKLVLSLGVELIKVNKVLEYEQSNYMEQYIMLNTNLRQKCKNDFEKDFYKLMNNSVFGKTMENVRNRINFRLISTEDEALRVKNMKRFTIFDENLVGLHIHKKKVKLNKPIYIGQNILDDSKYLMYNFHYNFMLKNVERENIDLLFTDTDSLCYNIRKQDIYEIMNNNRNEFDLSDYAKDHPLYDATNKKVIGKFKDEGNGKIIDEFVGLRAKLYTFTIEDEHHSHNKCKGVKKSVAENEITIDDYRHTLFNRESKTITQNGIRSYGHQLYTERVNKVALSCRDDKVHICDDNVKTYNHGHYKTKSF